MSVTLQGVRSCDFVFQFSRKHLSQSPPRVARGGCTLVARAHWIRLTSRTCPQASYSENSLHVTCARPHGVAVTYVGRDRDSTCDTSRPQRCRYGIMRALLTGLQERERDQAGFDLPRRRRLEIARERYAADEAAAEQDLILSLGRACAPTEAACSVITPRRSVKPLNFWCMPSRTVITGGGKTHRGLRSSGA